MVIYALRHRGRLTLMLGLLRMAEKKAIYEKPLAIFL